MYSVRGQHDSAFPCAWIGCQVFGGLTTHVTLSYSTVRVGKGKLNAKDAAETEDHSFNTPKAGVESLALSHTM